MTTETTTTATPAATETTTPAAVVETTTPAAVEATATETPAETTEATATETPAETTEPVEAPKEANGFQRRVERAKAKARAESAAEIEYWKQQAMAASAPPQTTQPRSNNKPELADYPDMTSYIDAHSQWVITNTLAQQAQQAQQHQAVSQYNTRAAAYAKANPTFAEDVQDLVDTYADSPVPELTQLAYESDVGPALVHYLSKHQDEMERIVALPSHRRLIALGKLEDKLAATPAAVVAPQKKSSAPTPATPEKGTPTTKKSLDDPNLSQAEYRALRAAQLVAKGHFAR